MNDVVQAREARISRRRARVRTLLPGARVVSGAEWSRSFTCTNAAAEAFGSSLPVSWTDFQLIRANAARELEPMLAATVVSAITRDNSGYDPGIVARILRLDAQEPEAKFDNVVDMMDWLERD